MTVESLIHNLEARGANLAVEGDQIVIEAPLGALGRDELEILRQHKPELLGLLVARHCERTGEDLAGHLDCNPGLRALVERPVACEGWIPAQSIVATCQRHGVALRIDPQTGDLVVGRAGANADEPSQPWPSLLLAIEAHLEAVAALVAAGWSLQAAFAKEKAA